MKNRSVYALAIAAILGACVFVLTNPELASVAAGSKPPAFKPGECVTGNFAFPGESWVIAERLEEFVVETYKVEEVSSGRVQAIQVSRIRRCGTASGRSEHPAASHSRTDAL